MITVYATQTCPWCSHVERYLSMKGVEYQKVYVDDDVEKRQELLEKTGMMSVPVTTDGEEYIVGWNPAKLSQLLQK